MADDVDCPYCGEPQEINHDDGAGYQEDTLHQQMCGDCRRNFTFTTAILYSYTSYKADCLNGEEHKWEPTHTHPSFMTKMRCPDCEEERELTEEERAKYVTETKEQYFQRLKDANVGGKK